MPCTKPNRLKMTCFFSKANGGKSKSSTESITALGALAVPGSPALGHWLGALAVPGSHALGCWLCLVHSHPFRFFPLDTGFDVA